MAASFEGLCRARGVRVTAQRLAVYRVLAADASHPSADAVYARLRPRVPGLSRTTVYRVLDTLQGEGLVRRVSTTRGVARYDAITAPHQHLVCRSCGSMEDFVSPALSGLAAPRTAGRGFRVEELDIRLVGTCARCSGKS